MIEHGTPNPDILNTPITIALGRNREDRNWRNVSGTLGQFIAANLSTHKIGDKDGLSMTQGQLSAPQRVSKNVVTNYLVNYDFDNGTNIDDIVSLLVENNIFAVLYTTHSHLKPVTEIAEAAFEMWQRKQTDDIRAQSLQDRIALYLWTEKRYAKEICEKLFDVERIHGEGGIKYRVTHPPMHRFRVVFPLAQPYSFAEAAETQAAAIERWKALYASWADKLGAGWDRACVDPARLSYLPRHALDADADQHVVHIIYGDLLTIERMGQAPIDIEGMEAFDAFGPAGDTTEFVTPNLKQFLAKHSATFEAANFLEAVAPDDVRNHRASGGIEHVCPNEDAHSTVTAEDRAFFATNASESLSGWMMYCMHATCIAASNKDRAFYLDLACQKYGITDAMQLRAFCFEEATQQAAAVVEQGATIAKQEETTPGSLDERIAALTPDSSAETVEAILRAIAQSDGSSLTATQRVRRVGQAIDLLVATKQEYRRILAENAQRAQAAIGQADDEVAGTPREPSNIDTYQGVIPTSWHEDVQARVARNIINNRNAEDPHLFRRPEGGIVMAVRTPRGVVLRPLETIAQWVQYVGKHCRFMRPDERVGDMVAITPPANIVAMFANDPDWELPICDRVVRIASLGKDGIIQDTAGYDIGTQTYIDPNIEMLPVSIAPTEDAVDQAKALLVEMLRDFPFSDRFEGADELPVKLDEVDEDGFPLPNLERGRGSRLAAIAMMLQPFVRAYIDGPCPAYHIDKPAPGTGAGYLVDAAHIVAEGTRAIGQTMSENNEEFRKAITATLREGSSIVFIDNINRPVTSGHLAAALTVGVWRDRILGVSETATIPITATWIMAGNNLSFSAELMRRNIPIRLDAGTPNPAMDRTSGKDFKHYPYQPWLLSRRQEMVWACHTLIANWIARGAKWGSAQLHSFDAWAGVMSGIFEDAGITGFLQHRAGYLGVDAPDDEIGFSSLVNLLHERFGDATMSVRDILGVLDNPMSPVSLSDLGVDAPTTHGKITQLGAVLRQQVKGRSFSLPGGEIVQVEQGRTNAARTYRIRHR